MVFLKAEWEDSRPQARLVGDSAKAHRLPTRRETVSEDESRRVAAQDEDSDEVEAHGRRVAANDEAGDEDDKSEDDEVEGHSRRVE